VKIRRRRLVAHRTLLDRLAARVNERRLRVAILA